MMGPHGVFDARVQAGVRIMGVVHGDVAVPIAQLWAIHGRQSR